MRRIIFAAAGLLLSGTVAHADLDGYVQVDQGRYLATAGDCAACHASEKVAGQSRRRSATSMPRI